MRLEKLCTYLTQAGYRYTFREENDCGTIEFDHRGLHYHIWEFPEPERGAESNLLSAGRSVDYEGDYEEQLLEILRSWQNPQPKEEL